MNRVNFLVQKKEFQTMSLTPLLDNADDEELKLPFIDVVYFGSKDSLVGLLSEHVHSVTRRGTLCVHLAIKPSDF